MASKPDDEVRALTRQFKSDAEEITAAEARAAAQPMPKFTGEATIKRTVLIERVTRSEYGPWLSAMFRLGGTTPGAMDNASGPLFLEQDVGVLLYNVDPTMLDTELEITITVRRKPRGE